MENKSNTLVILTPAFPARESEDTWVVSQQLFVKTAKKIFPGLHIIVLSFFYPYHDSPYVWNTIPVLPFDGMKKRKLKRVLLWRQIWKKLKIINYENKIVGIFSFWCGECALIGRYFARSNGLTHLIWICGQDARATNKWIKIIRPQADELVAMSQFLAREFFKNHKIRPGYIIPNGIEPGMFSNVLKQKDIDILGAGSLEIPKQYNVQVKVVASLQKSYPEIKSLHAGMGPEKENLQALVRELKLERNFSLLGVKTHPEVLELMQRTKLFLHPSLYEGFSTVCLEALYAGAHVISFCHPGEKAIPHWHVADNLEHMKAIAEKILMDPGTDYQPILVHTMNESVREVIKLFRIIS